MDQAEFDKFATEYCELHAANIRLSGEQPEYFAEYKVADVARYLSQRAVQPRQILDFGAGIGGSVPHFRKHLPGAALTCLDVSRTSLELGQRRFPGEATFRDFDGTTIPFTDGTFDAAFAACVFHHISADEHVLLLNELRRILRTGGYFFLFEHNPLNPLTVHAVNTCPFDENAVLIRHSELWRRLRRAGFRNIECRVRIFLPRALRALRPLEDYLAWCPLGAQYFLVGQR